MKIKSEFIKSTFIYSFFTLISRFTGFLRDFVMARFLGTNAYSDIFIIALKIPNMLRRSFLDGSISMALIPYMESQKNKKDDSLKKNTQNIFSFLFITSVALTAITYLFMPSVIKIITPGFVNNPSKYKLTIHLARILILSLPILTIVSFYGSILLSFKKYILFSLTPVIMNFCMSLSMYLSKNQFDELKIKHLSYFTIISYFLQIALLIFDLVKIKFLMLPKLKFHKEKIKHFLKSFIPSFLSVSILQINTLIGSFFASSFEGIISCMYYVERMYQLPLTLIGTAIQTISLRFFSDINQNQSEMDKLKKNIQYLFLYIIFPISYISILYSKEIVYSIFYYGKINEQNIHIMSKLLLVSFISLPCSIGYQVINSLISSKKKHTKLLLPSIISIVMNISLNIIFTNILSGEIRKLSIAISLSISNVISFFYIYSICRKECLINKISFKIIIKWLIYFIISFGLIYTLRNNLFITVANKINFYKIEISIFKKIPLIGISLFFSFIINCIIIFILDKIFKYEKKKYKHTPNI